MSYRRRSLRPKMSRGQKIFLWVCVVFIIGCGVAAIFATPTGYQPVDVPTGPLG